MRLLAIGDIHGHLRALDALLQRIELRSSDLVVTLGDYVDGGPDSRGVLDRLIRLHQNANHVAIRGNHDQMMLDARWDAFEREFWLTLGGASALASYPEASLERVPAEHFDFLEHACVDFYETEAYIFVHAHVEPNLPLDRQPRKTMHWLGLEAARPHQSGKLVVCGHTPQESGWPANLGHTVCVDTVGWLTCLDLNSGQIWQSDDRGHTRDGAIVLEGH